MPNAGVATCPACTPASCPPRSKRRPQPAPACVGPWCGVGCWYWCWLPLSPVCGCGAALRRHPAPWQRLRPQPTNLHPPPHRLPARPCLLLCPSCQPCRLRRLSAPLRRPHRSPRHPPRWPHPQRLLWAHRPHIPPPCKLPPWPAPHHSLRRPHHLLRRSPPSPPLWHLPVPHPLPERPRLPHQPAPQAAVPRPPRLRC